LECDRIKSINAIAREALLRHDKGVDEWYEEQRMVADEDENAEDSSFLEELYADQKEDAGEAYPQLFFKSIFASAYGSFEQYLNSICLQDAKQRAGVGLKDLRGEGIHRARLYLTKVAGKTFPATSEWRDLCDYGLLRNALLHTDGDLSSNTKAPSVVQLAARVKTFAIAADLSDVTLTGDFNDMFVDTVERFGEQLRQAVQ
jgi:hypothetical protein